MSFGFLGPTIRRWRQVFVQKSVRKERSSSDLNISRSLKRECKDSCSELKLSRKSVEMAEEEKVFSRVLTKEASMAESCNASNSFKVYYGGVSAGVPFRWESRPGTPKHKFSDNSIPPPLTPPPSYYCTRNSQKKTSTKQNLLRSLFPKLRTSPKKLYAMSKSSFYSVSSSSSSRVSSCSSPTAFLSPKFQYGEKGGGAVGSESKNLFCCFVGRFLSPALPNGECQECNRRPSLVISQPSLLLRSIPV